MFYLNIGLFTFLSEFIFDTDLILYTLNFSWFPLHTVQGDGNDVQIVFLGECSYGIRAYGTGVH